MEDNILELSMPKDLANLQLPSPELYDYYKDRKNRIYWLDTDVDEDSLELVRIIMRCNMEDEGIPADKRVPITIFIDSPGGDVIVCWTIINAMKMSVTPIRTVNACTAYSAAGHILAAGHERYALPGTSVLVHSGAISISGTVEQSESIKKFIDFTLKKVNDNFIANTKIDAKTMKRKSPFDWYMDENEALKYGIIDKIITDYSELGRYE